MIEFARPGLPTDNYTMVPNHLWTDDRLNGNAVRLVGYILSRPAGWRMNRARIMAAVALGDSAFDTAVAKAEDAGWLIRGQSRDDGGRMANTRYSVAFPTVTGKPGDGDTATGLSGHGKPGLHTGGNPVSTPAEIDPLSKTESKTDAQEGRASALTDDEDAETGLLLAPPEPGAYDDEDRRRDRVIADRMRASVLARGAKRAFTVDEDAVDVIASLRADGYSHEELDGILRFVHGHRFWGGRVRTPKALRLHADALAIEANANAHRTAPESMSDRARGWGDSASNLKVMGVR